MSNVKSKKVKSVANADLGLLAEVDSVAIFSPVNPLAQVEVVAEYGHRVLLGGAVEQEQALHVSLCPVQLFPPLVKLLLEELVLHDVNTLDAEVHVEPISLHLEKLSLSFSKSIGQRIIFVKLPLWQNFCHLNNSLCLNHTKILHLK